MKRDAGLNKGDQLKITIDTFHDHRNAFYFSTNPLGAYKDANTVENGRTINYDWNAVWDNKTFVALTEETGRGAFFLAFRLR